MRRLCLLLALAGALAAAPPRLEPVRIVGDLRGVSINALDVAVTDDGTIYLLLAAGRVAVFAPDGAYRESRPVDLPGKSTDYGISTVGNSIFLDNFPRDFPWLLDPTRHGDAPGRFDDPRDAAFDAGGNLYVADTANKRLQVFKPDDLEHPVAVWDVPREPLAVVVRGRGVAVVGRDQVLRLYRRAGKELEELGTAKVVADRVGLALAPDGAVLVASRGRPGQDQLCRYRLVDGKLVEDGVLAPSWWTRWPGFLPDPVPLATGPDGGIYYAATDQGCILRLDPRTDEVAVAVSKLYHPYTVGVAANGDMIVTSQGPQVTRFPAAAETRADGVPFTRKPLFKDANVPIWGLLPLAGGDLMIRVVEPGRRNGWPAVTIKRVTPAGEATTMVDFGPLFAKRIRFAPWECFTGMAMLPDGNIALSVHPMQAVFTVTPTGDILWEAGLYPEGGADKVEFQTVRDVAADRRGRIWAVDAGADRVVCLSPAGKLLLTYGQPGDVDDGDGAHFASPSGVAVTTVDGQEYLYVADAGNQRLVKLRIVD